jgi:hypothetical protein
MVPAKATGMGVSAFRSAVVAVVATPAAELRAVAKAAANAKGHLVSTLQLASAIQAADADAGVSNHSAGGKDKGKKTKATPSSRRREDKAAATGSPVSTRSTQHLVLWCGSDLEPESMALLPGAMPPVKAIVPLTLPSGAMRHAMVTCVDGSVWEVHIHMDGDEGTADMPQAIPYASAAVAARVLPAAAAAAAAADAAIPEPPVAVQVQHLKQDSNFELGPLHTLPGVRSLASFLLKPLLHSTSSAPGGNAAPQVQAAQSGDGHEEDESSSSLGRVIFEPAIEIDLASRLMEMCAGQEGSGALWRDAGHLAIFADDL